jgi:hypothetical protein
MRLNDATVVFPNGLPMILASRWNPWWPYSENYARFLKSNTVPSLRSEYGVYLVDPAGGKPKYLFAGHRLVPSPDRMRVAYLTSENGHTGFHNIMVYDVMHECSIRVVSLLATGSGLSFSYNWSSDGAGLLITGDCGGFKPAAREYLPIHMFYEIDRDTLSNLGN